MAQRGRKPDPPAMKVARGTMAAMPDVLAQMARVPGDVPQKSEYLGADCDAIWEREIDRFVAGGATGRDSALVNMIVYRLACFEKQAEMSQTIGEDGTPLCDPPPITLTEQLRIGLEQFGMAGPKSRVVATGTKAPPRNNPFAANGQRPRA